MEVHVLKVPFSFNGREDSLYPVILRSSSETILVDCGYPGFMPLIEVAAQVHGLSLRDITGVLITHHDLDHMGGLAEIKAAYPSLKVYAAELDEPYISGKEKSLRLVQAEYLYDSLPEEQKPGALYFQEMLMSMIPVAVDHTFTADEEPAVLSGARIIHTPGHMPGHISIFLPDNRTLIAADAVVVEDGELEIANPHFTLDLPEAVASVDKLRMLAIDKLVCYHGGVVEGNIQHRLNKLVGRYT
ncbi:MBL fold metallo-hydrolase [Telluribacter sp. SYSU D00476]|uniref:MBL fold metallo-hydrolase n=1 Tax=Telluribacter sp. SYSU D00476 TaxID=2811430 RepID=UPI001FF6AE48|nr:MBL fold metallo-hydrolase [Telluribacter sp. SYSU D00476]